MGVVISKKAKIKNNLALKRFETLKNVYMKLDHKEIWILPNMPSSGTKFRKIDKSLQFEIYDVVEHHKFPNAKSLCAKIKLCNMKRRYISKRMVYIKLDCFFEIDAFHNVKCKNFVKEIK